MSFTWHPDLRSNSPSLTFGLDQVLGVRSELQRDASIEDQLRLCQERAEREGWRIADSYSDRSISGASLIRPGVQALMEDAQRQRFDIVLAEALDRISRDQEEIAGVYKRLTFAGVRMVTLSEGDITELHIGLKGTMGALYLKDLADKTRRGLGDGSRTASRAAATPTAITGWGPSTIHGSVKRRNGISATDDRRAGGCSVRTIWRSSARSCACAKAKSRSASRRCACFC